MRQINTRDITRKFNSIGDSEYKIGWGNAYDKFSINMIQIAFDFIDNIYDRTPNL